jgi:glycine/D-amino acid oxidase-like deaminating enzyme
MSETFDAVVIGGGIIGASIAEALTGAGRAVALLERGRLATATTGNSFAWVNATAKTADAAYHRLNAAGVAEYQALAQRFGAETIGLRGRGGLHWGDAATIETRAARLIELGDPVRRLSLAELRALEPNVAFPDDAVGLLASADRWLDAPRCTARLARVAAEGGGAVRENTDVTGFLHADGRLAGVHTYAGTIRAATVVIAAGVETAPLVELASGFTLPVRRVPGGLVNVPADLAGGLVEHVLHPPGTPDLDVRPGDNGGLLLGSEQFTAALAEGTEAAALRPVVDQVLAGAARLLPDLPLEAARRRARLRVGVRPIPADEHTIAGPVPGTPGLWAAVTHSGVTLGPLLGRLLAQEIAGGAPSPLLAKFRPDRFSAQ